MIWPCIKKSHTRHLTPVPSPVPEADKRLEASKRLVERASKVHAVVAEEKQKNHFAADTRSALEIGPPPRWT